MKKWFVMQKEGDLNWFYIYDNIEGGFVCFFFIFRSYYEAYTVHVVSSDNKKKKLLNNNAVKYGNDHLNEGIVVDFLFKTSW